MFKRIIIFLILDLVLTIGVIFITSNEPDNICLAGGLSCRPEEEIVAFRTGLPLRFIVVVGDYYGPYHGFASWRIEGSSVPSFVIDIIFWAVLSWIIVKSTFKVRKNNFQAN